MKKIILLALVLSVCAVPAFAKKKYNAQGCGLGAMLFTEDSLLHNVLGATTNGTSANQTFGMSSGTLGCEVTSSEPTKKSAYQEVYIEANKVALANNIARGNGETLTGLTKLYGCKDTAKVGPTLQKNYQTIFPNETITAQDINQNINTVLTNTKTCI